MSETVAAEQQHDVAIIVVGMNAREYVRGCFSSLRSAAWRNYSNCCVYVDNGSSDGTVEAVRDEFPEVTIIANPRNLGFCVAANQGARAVKAPYLVFLNDDTVVLEDAIPQLVEFMAANQDFATAGARLVFPDGREQWSGRRFPDFTSSIFGRRSWLARRLPRLGKVKSYLCKEEVAAGTPFECDWVSAAGQIFRTSDYWSVGGYAEDYYYWHEMVICLRLKRHGRKVALLPGCRIIHYEGQGSGPRPFSRQRFHIIDFHRGAFRAYLEQHRLRWYSARALLVAAGLLARGAALLLIARVRTLFERTESPRKAVTSGRAISAG